MARLKFGAFLAPHHPIGEHPALQFRRDSISCSSSTSSAMTSSGAANIIPPAGRRSLHRDVLAAAGERTKRIKLGTGVVSAALSPPLQRRAAHGAARPHDRRPRHLRLGPGALASDAHTLGIDPMTQRDRQDEAIAVIRRLFNGERVTVKSDWFEMNDAALQILAAAGGDAVRRRLADFASGMTLAANTASASSRSARCRRRPDGAAAAMGIRRGRGEEGRHHR